MIAICFTIVMLIVDLIYAYIDPRIRAKYARTKECTMENLELTDTQQNINIFKKQSQAKEIWRRFKRVRALLLDYSC